jgi:glutamyl-Q tRNA(Asp) synthetase
LVLFQARIFMTSYFGQYIGRFAPSPTGPLHAGSLVAALASWLDARAHGGQWLVRMEDVDAPRCIQGMDAVILNQLAAFGMMSDAPVVYQSQRTDLYEAALIKLKADSLVYRCYCSRKSIAMNIYQCTCREALWNKGSGAEYPAGQYAYRLRVNDLFLRWQDRRLGAQAQNVAQEVGDFVIKRADALFAYQLAVVVDDADQGINHIVRGEDLADNTARQIGLQAALGLPMPQYLHVPLVLAEDGQKLSKQNGAKALDINTHESWLRELNATATALGLSRQPNAHTALGESLMAWTQEWRTIYA